MKTKPETKQQLLERIGAKDQSISQLQVRVDRLKAEDLRLRQQFSKVLNAPRTNEYRGSEPTTYSWEEIFAEIGRKISADATLTMWSRLENFESRITTLEALKSQPDPSGNPR